MKHAKAVVAGGLAVIVLVVTAGCSGSNQADSPSSRTAAVTRGDLTLDISAAGNLAFSRTEDLPIDLFYQQGTVSEVLAEVGDSVSEGDELVKLDPDEWQSNLDTLRDTVTSAQRLVDTRTQAVATAERTRETKLRAVTDKQNAVAAALAQVTAKQLAVTQAELNVTTANNTVNNLQDIEVVLDKIDETNQTIATATMILNSSSVYGVSLSITDRNYFVNLIAGSNSFLVELNARLAALLDGSAPMSTSQLQLQLQQNQLTLQGRQLDLANAQTALAQAQQGVAYAETDLGYARDDYEAAGRSVAYAQEDLANAQDGYDTAGQDLVDAQAKSPVITAPFDGVITRINVAGGDKVARNTVAIVIADPSRFQADILVSELDILQINTGDTATVTADAVSGAVFAAIVTRIAPTATIQSGVVNYAVTVELQALTPIVTTPAGGGPGNLASSDNATGFADRLQQAVDAGLMTEEQARQLQQRFSSGNFTLPSGGAGGGGAGLQDNVTPPAGGFGGGFANGGQGGFVFENAGSGSTPGQAQSQLPGAVGTSYEIRQGLTVTVSITIAARTDVLLVPNAAVTTSGGLSYVQVVNAAGQEEQRQVEIGLNDWQNTEITSGLEEGETVAVPLNIGTSSSSSSSSSRGIFGLGR